MAPRTKKQTDATEAKAAEHVQSDADRVARDSEQTIAASDEQRMLAEAREKELSKLAGDLPNDPAALWMYAEHSMAQAAVSLIDAGRCLIKLKEILPHGEYEEGLRSRGISPRSARDISASARRFADRSEKFLKLGRSKLYACLEFSDSQIDALENGDSVLGHTLDEFDRMSHREMKDALKKSRADNDVKDQLLEDKNRHIDRQAGEIERLSGTLKPGERSPICDQIADATRMASSALMTLAEAVRKVDDDDMHAQAALHGGFEQMRATFAAVREDLLTRFPDFNMALDDASTEAWQPQQEAA